MQLGLLGTHPQPGGKYRSKTLKQITVWNEVTHPISQQWVVNQDATSGLKKKPGHVWVGCDQKPMPAGKPKDMQTGRGLSERLGDK
jgi:hypothetical protein